MALKIGFGKDSGGEAQELLVEEGDGHETITIEEKPAKKAPVSRLLLLLLLLVVVAGAGYFYLIGPPAEEPSSPPPKASAPVKRAIVQPAPKKAPAAADAAVKPAGEAGAVASPVVKVEDVSPAATAAAAAQPAAAPTVAVTEAAAPKTAESQTAEPEAAVSAPPAVASAGSYLLDAGTYLFAGNRSRIEKAVRRLGFEPRSNPLQRSVEMVRLRVGVFSPAEAKVHLEEVRKTASDAFILPQGDGIAVYAGSFFDLDTARTFADDLYQHGIRTEEEKAQVPMTLQRLTFGSFDDHAAAQAAAAKAKAAGIEVTVVRK